MDSGETAPTHGRVSLAFGGAISSLNAVQPMKSSAAPEDAGAGDDQVMPLIARPVSDATGAVSAVPLDEHPLLREQRTLIIGGVMSPFDRSGHCLAVRYRLPFICDDPDVVGLGVDPVCCLDKVGDDLS
jgi:hypothetical protein